MTENQFSELRPYFESEGSCIDTGYRPLESLIRRGWVTEIVTGCWAITEGGRRAFQAVVAGTAGLT